MTTTPHASAHRRLQRGWLLLFATVALAGTMAFLLGDRLRALIGRPGMPSGEGAEPTAPLRATAALPKATLPRGAAGEAPVRLQAPPSAAPSPVPAPAATSPLAPGHRDQAAGVALLAQAEVDYRSYRWEAARSAAGRLGTLDVEPAIAARARAIALGAVELQQLFAQLGDADDLARNLDTSPGHVRITIGSGVIDAVPVSGGTAEEPQLVEQDPIAWIEAAQARGPVSLLIKGQRRYMLGQLADGIGAIVLVNQAALRADNELAFSRKLAALRNSARSEDALAWYDAALFAYQNRLDAHVVEALDQALARDPFLTRSVREDKAQRCCAAMLMQMRLGNKEGAARTWLGIIARRYGDTAWGRLAPKLFEGDARAVVGLAQAQQQQLAAEASERDRQLLARARQDGDLAAVERLSAPQDAPAVAIRPQGAAGDRAAAQQAMDAGYALEKAAMDMPLSQAKNDRYRSALGHFQAAIAQYRALAAANPGDAELGLLLVEADEQAAVCRKYMTPF